MLLRDRRIALMIVAVLFCLFAMAGASPVRGDTVVNRCDTDNAGVAGDLRTALAAGGRVTFNCPAGTVIPMTMTHFLRTSTTIDGGGLITLDARGTVSMFSMSDPASVLTLRGLTLRRGRSIPGSVPIPSPGGAYGGVVSGRGIVEVMNSTIQDTANAIWMVDGAAKVTDSEFADGAGTAISAPTIELVRTKVHGTVIHPVSNSGGTVSIRDSQFTGGNTSTFDKCRLSITGSKFLSSISTAVISGCDTEISGGEFSNNHGQNGGALFLTKSAAGLRINGVKFAGNVADRAGGAIAFEPTTGPERVISLADVVFENNRAIDGGAVHLGGFIENNLKLVGRALIFSKNQAKNTGGAIAGTNAQVTLARALFTGNSAGNWGGAISILTYAQRPSVIANSIFNGNTSPRGSALLGSNTQFLNVTIANSQGGPALSPFWPAPEPWRIISFHNVAFSGNTAAVCDPNGGNHLNNPLFRDDGHNVQFPAGGCPADIPVADPKFDSMFIPAMGGAANGKGDLTTCTAAPVNGVDLFGRHRPQGKNCSIGAVEGDIEDAVVHANPQFHDPPKLPPNTCPCDSDASTANAPPTTPAPPSIVAVPPVTPPATLTQPSTSPTKDMDDAKGTSSTPDTKDTNDTKGTHPSIAPPSSPPHVPLPPHLPPHHP